MISKVLYYAQLQQYHLHSGNSVYTTLFILGALLLAISLAYLFYNLKTKSHHTSYNFLSGANPCILGHIFIILFAVSMGLFGFVGMKLYYHEISSLSWTKLFNQVIICNGSGIDTQFLENSYEQYQVPLNKHGVIAKSALLRSLGNLLANHTLSGKDLDPSMQSSFAMGDGSYIGRDTPLLLDFRNLFTRNFPFIYFTCSEQMKMYLKLTNLQFFSCSLLTSSIFITLSSLRVTILANFSASPRGLFSSGGFLFLNLYGISRLLFFPVLEIWTGGGFLVLKPDLLDYFLNFQWEYSSNDQSSTGRFSWIIGALKHYITIIERLALFIIVCVFIAKLTLKKPSHDTKFAKFLSPEELIGYLFLLQKPDTPKVSSTGSNSSHLPLYSLLSLLRMLLLWNLISHVSIFCLNLSFKQLALIQHPLLADTISYSILCSESLIVLTLLMLFSSLAGPSSLFWKSAEEIESAGKNEEFQRLKYDDKLDLSNPHEAKEAFDEINSLSAIPRAVYKPPVDYELPVWAKDQT